MKGIDDIKSDILAAVEDIQKNDLNFSQINEKYGHLIQLIWKLECENKSLIPEGGMSIVELMNLGLSVESDVNAQKKRLKYFVIKNAQTS